MPFGTTRTIAGIDIDHMHGFSVLNDEIGTVLVGDGTSERRFDLPSHRKVVEDGDFAFVELNDILAFGCNECNVIAHFFVDLFIVDRNALERRVEKVAQQANGTAGLFIDESRLVLRIMALYLGDGTFPASQEDA